MPMVFECMASATTPHPRRARPSAVSAKLCVCFAALFLLFLLGEEPASQILRVGQLSAHDLSAIHERAVAGDANAQVLLGIAYDGGSRVFKRDPNEARRWYDKAAKQGNLD